MLQAAAMVPWLHQLARTLSLGLSLCGCACVLTKVSLHLFGLDGSGHSRISRPVPCAATLPPSLQLACRDQNLIQIAELMQGDAYVPCHTMSYHHLVCYMYSCAPIGAGEWRCLQYSRCMHLQ